MSTKITVCLTTGEMLAATTSCRQAMAIEVLKNNIKAETDRHDDNT